MDDVVVVVSENQTLAEAWKMTKLIVYQSICFTKTPNQSSRLTRRGINCSGERNPALKKEVSKFFDRWDKCSRFFLSSTQVQGGLVVEVPPPNLHLY
jgi:hypothetical protein